MIDLDLQGQISLRSQNLPHFDFVCPCDKSPLIEVRISKFWPKMHLSTVKAPIDFGIDWPWYSVLFLISNQLFFFQTLHLSFICVVLYIFSEAIASECSTSHMAPQIYWSHECGQGPAMDHETVYLNILVRPQEFQPASTRQLALDFTSCYRFSTYYIRFACRNFICKH